MYEIPMEPPTEAFAECWRAAGTHIQSVGRQLGDAFVWLKARLEPPFLEHLSFKLGNQLYFVRVEAVDDPHIGPGLLRGLLHIADECRGYACVLPMRRAGSDWIVDRPGWGLVDPMSGEPVDPTSLATDEPIEMTDWELHDFAVQVVRDWLESEGHSIMSSHAHPDIDPSIWFVGDRGPEWVVVRAVRYPAREATPPPNMADIAARCAAVGRHGNFASVAAVSANQPFQQGGEPAVALWRGGPMYVNFAGLVPVRL